MARWLARTCMPRLWLGWRWLLCEHPPWEHWYNSGHSCGRLSVALEIILLCRLCECLKRFQRSSSKVCGVGTVLYQPWESQCNGPNINMAPAEIGNGWLIKNMIFFFFLLLFFVILLWCKDCGHNSVLVV